jgi:hypothetical protein
LNAACSGSGEATPTRTPRAIADNSNPTQTPWIIYIPVTVTPEPFTATPLPTVTSAKPTPKPTNTREPVTPRPTSTKAPANTPTSAVPTEIPPTAAPTNTLPPSCGQTYTVTKLTFPEQGAVRTAKAGGGAGHTVQFMFDPAVAFKLGNPKIGYQVYVQTPVNSQSIYISHDFYLTQRYVVLSQQATYGLTQGDDATATWNVTVVMASGGFNDQGDPQTAAQGIISTCGPVSPSSSFILHVE